MKSPNSKPGRRLSPCSLSMARIALHWALDKPLAYLFSSQPFLGLPFAMRRPVLIPRPETEEWTALVLQHLENLGANPNPNFFSDLDQTDGPWHKSVGRRPIRILDLCCGSGCIGIAVAHGLAARQQPVELHCVDRSTRALTLTAANARRLLMHQSGSMTIPKMAVHVRTHQMDLLATPLSLLKDLGPFDVVLCNPPYIPVHRRRRLAKSVALWEATCALFPMACQPGSESIETMLDDGCLFYEKLLPQLSDLVAIGGLCVFEIDGLSQQPVLLRLLSPSHGGQRNFKGNFKRRDNFKRSDNFKSKDNFKGNFKRSENFNSMDNFKGMDLGIDKGLDNNLDNRATKRLPFTWEFKRDAAGRMRTLWLYF